jgi:vanillate O-demethylase ferredoxin subunit
MSGETLPVVVTSAEFVAQDVRELRLARGDGQALPAFTPGSHIDVHLAPGLVRQYSLCGEIENAAYTIAVKREADSRGGSEAVHETIRAGDHLTISAPRNHFPLDAGAPHSVLVAGGIGITPLLAMARVLSKRGSSFQLEYFARSVDHAAYADWLKGSPLAGRCQFHWGLSIEATRAALVDTLANRTAGAQLYLCGPHGFMHLVREVAAYRGWPAESVHLEYFNAGQATEPLPGSDLRVRLARSGTTIPVAADVPIIDALRAAGIGVETSCEQGVCGTCITRVLGGVPDHRDLFLTEAEKARGDCMAICVSRSLTPELVLDL